MTATVFPAVDSATVEAAQSVVDAARELWPSEPVTVGPFAVTLDRGGSATAAVRHAGDDGEASGIVELTCLRLRANSDDSELDLAFRGDVVVNGKSYKANRTRVWASRADGELSVEAGWAAVVTARGASAQSATQQQASKVVAAAVAVALADMTCTDFADVRRAVARAGQVAEVVGAAKATVEALDRASDDTAAER